MQWQESPFGSSERPAVVRVDGFLPGGGSGDDDAADSPSRSRDWWTRSSWAFLNEPPQGWKGGEGFVSKEKIEEVFAGPKDDAKVLLCGESSCQAAALRAC